MIKTKKYIVTRISTFEKYQALEKFIETKVASISTSPERNDTILIVDPFSG